MSATADDEAQTPNEPQRGAHVAEHRGAFCPDRRRLASGPTRGGGGRLPQGFFTPAEIAAYLRMSTYTVQDLCRRGELRHVKARRSIRIRREWADQYMATYEREPLLR
ncbi:MAG TPA: helix-turn-helix domain-containing protein [Vicinamibacterales bacterium]|jgi:excisionase family DNA binding protein|nr:helix-turn-helix domain-containing protein [Vicinamibacterales bacterium]